MVVYKQVVSCLKDIPVFTTDYGVASIILKEVPYKDVAFVHVQDVQPGQLKEHLEDCAGFCRAAGAERIYATGHEELAAYPLHCIVYEMSVPLENCQPEANLWPVTAETVGRWREIYNAGMGSIDNHATMTFQDEKKILESGGAYFAHKEGELIGIGWMEGSELLALVSVVPGMGETVARTLFTVVNSDRITLEVVSINERALRLYKRMGFVITGERSRWYRI